MPSSPSPRAALCVLVGAGLALALCGCRSMEAIQADFDAYVETVNACGDDAECTVIYPGCPLGCFTAVRVDRREEAEAYARNLVASYELGGPSCEYDCLAHDPARCDEGHCLVEPTE